MMKYKVTNIASSIRRFEEKGKWIKLGPGESVETEYPPKAWAFKVEEVKKKSKKKQSKKEESDDSEEDE